VILPLGSGAPASDAAPPDAATDAVHVDLPDARTTDLSAGDLPSPDLPPLPTTVTTLAGNGQSGAADGPALSAQFQEPHDVAVDSKGKIYVADFRNHCIRLLTRGAGGDTVSTVAGTCGSPGALIFPTSVTLSADESTLYIAEYGAQRIRAMDTATGKLTNVAGSGAMGYKDGTLDEAQFDEPGDVAVVEAAGTTVLYVTEFGGHRIRAIDLAQGSVSTLCGSAFGHQDGACATARFASPHMLVHDATNDGLYVTDFGSDCVRRVDLATKMVSTVGTCDFNEPSGLAPDAARGLLYVSEFGGNKIRTLDLATGTITDLAGTGVAGWKDGAAAAAQFKAPEGLFLHQGKLYVADFYGHRIRVIE
jgi:DNA-binding beta-propeller fold protein YncE